MDHHPKSLAGRIQIIKKETGLNQSDIGRLAKVTKGMVSQWVRGPAKTMGYAHASNLERELGYASRWLINGTEPKMAPGRKLGISVPLPPTTEELLLIEKLRRLFPDQLAAVISMIDKEADKAGLYEQEVKRRFGMDKGEMPPAEVEPTSLVAAAQTPQSAKTKPRGKPRQRVKKGA